MNWLQRFMYGRYGNDPLNLALLGVYVVLWLLARLFRSSLLWWLAMAVILWAFYRMLSRQIPRRQAENARFLDVVGPLRRKFNAHKCRIKDKEHCYFRCPNCGQLLRVPKGKGKVSITCRNCGINFEEKT